MDAATLFGLGFGLVEILIFLFVLGLFTGLPLVYGLLWSRVLRKMGYSGWWSVPVGLFPPFGEIIALFYLAFGEWPIHKQREQTGQIIDPQIEPRGKAEPDRA